LDGGVELGVRYVTRPWLCGRGKIKRPSEGGGVGVRNMTRPWLCGRGGKIKTPSEGGGVGGPKHDDVATFGGGRKRKTRIFVWVAGANRK